MAKTLKKFNTAGANTGSWMDLRDLLVGHPDPFSNSSGTFTGLNVTVGLLSKLGRLPDEWRAVWSNDKRDIRFAIWHYQTPIAWLAVRNGLMVWVVPAVKYTHTTSVLQNKIRVALEDINDSRPTRRRNAYVEAL
jgi:hypothetical protein